MLSQEETYNLHPLLMRCQLDQWWFHNAITGLSGVEDTQMHGTGILCQSTLDFW